MSNSETGIEDTMNTEMKREFLDAQAAPQGTEQGTLCFPLSKLYLRDTNRNGG